MVQGRNKLDRQASKGSTVSDDDTSMSDILSRENLPYNRPQLGIGSTAM